MGIWENRDAAVGFCEGGFQRSLAYVRVVKGDIPLGVAIVAHLPLGTFNTWHNVLALFRDIGGVTLSDKLRIRPH